MRMQKNGPVVYKRPFADDDDDGEFNPPFLNTMIRMNACMTRKIFVLNWFSMTMTLTHEKKVGLAFQIFILLIFYVSFKAYLNHTKWVILQKLNISNSFQIGK